MNKKIISILTAMTLTFSAFTMTANASPEVKSPLFDVNISAPTDTGDTTMNMNGATIPAPAYIVTIPEKIEFGKVEKKLKSADSSDRIAKTALNNVIANYGNLFVNEKQLIVSINSGTALLSNGSKTIPFEVYGEDDSKLTDEATLMTISPLSEDAYDAGTGFTNQSSRAIYCTFDKSQILEGGEYTGTITFTVALKDK